MFGISEKAIIEIEKDVVEDVTEEETKMLSASPSMSGLAGITDKLKSAATSMAKSALSAVVSNIAGDYGVDKEQLEVQFNPSELRIHATTKKSKPQTGIDVNHNRTEYGALGVQVNVTIPLVFDVSDGEYDAVSLNIKNKLGKEIGIEGKVESFINSVKDPYLRNIRFSWGNLLYEGQLHSVTANYTMFNKDGNPIHADVTLELLCRNKDKKSYWDEMCENMIS